MLMFGCGLSWLLVLVNLGLVMKGIPQGCPLSMMFIVALCLPWCRCLAAHEEVQTQLYADNLECVSGDPDLLLMLLGSPLVMSGWLVRSLLPVSVSF